MVRLLLLISVLVGSVALPVALHGPMRTDTNHSTVGFSVPIAGGLSQVTGKFTSYRIELDYDSEEPENSKLLVVIDATSVDTGIDARDEHIMAEDFLHASEFPEIHFEGFEVQTTDDPDRLNVLGVLTIRDISQDCELDVTILRSPNGGRQVGFHATTSFNRQDFGVHYKHSDIPDFIGDVIEVELHILTKPRG